MGEIETSTKYVIKTVDFVLIAVGAALYLALAFVAQLTAFAMMSSLLYPSYIITCLWMVWFGPFLGLIMNFVGRLLTPLAYGYSIIPGGVLDAIFLSPFEVLPYIVFRLLKCNPKVRDPKSIVVYLVTNVVFLFPQPYVWYLEAAYILGIIPIDFLFTPLMIVICTQWWITSIVSAIIAIPLLWVLTPVVLNLGLYVEDSMFLRKVPA